MNGNQYLIPANTKKGQLWFGIFMPVDAMIFGIGVGITLLALVILSVVGVLDNITKIFGNFEYFYDLDGHFVF